MIGFFQRLCCGLRGHQLEHWRNIYGDEINHMGGKRSIWKCVRCEVYKLRPELYEVASPSEDYRAGWRDGTQEALELLAAIPQDAARYRWLCANNFDKQGITQVHTWAHSWEPHSQTGDPIEWKQRVRGGALDRIIDEAMKAEGK